MIMIGAAGVKALAEHRTSIGLPGPGGVPSQSLWPHAEDDSTDAWSAFSWSCTQSRSNEETGNAVAASARIRSRQVPESKARTAGPEGRGSGRAAHRANGCPRGDAGRQSAPHRADRAASGPGGAAGTSNGYCRGRGTCCLPAGRGRALFLAAGAFAGPGPRKAAPGDGDALPRPAPVPGYAA